MCFLFDDDTTQGFLGRVSTPICFLGKGLTTQGFLGRVSTPICFLGKGRVVKGTTSDRLDGVSPKPNCRLDGSRAVNHTHWCLRLLLISRKMFCGSIQSISLSSNAVHERHHLPLTTRNNGSERCRKPRLVSVQRSSWNVGTSEVTLGPTVLLKRPVSLAGNNLDIQLVLNLSGALMSVGQSTNSVC